MLRGKRIELSRAKSSPIEASHDTKVPNTCPPRAQIPRRLSDATSSPIRPRPHGPGVSLIMRGHLRWTHAADTMTGMGTFDDETGSQDASSSAPSLPAFTPAKVRKGGGRGLLRRRSGHACCQGPRRSSQSCAVGAPPPVLRLSVGPESGTSRVWRLVGEPTGLTCIVEFPRPKSP